MNETPSDTRARLRRSARLSAVQALYQMELSGTGARAVVKQFRDHRFGHGGTNAAGFATALRIALEMADSAFLNEIEQNLALLEAAQEREFAAAAAQGQEVTA